MSAPRDLHADGATVATDATLFELFSAADGAKQRRSSTTSSLDAAESGAAPVVPLSPTRSSQLAPLELEKGGASANFTTDSTPAHTPTAAALSTPAAAAGVYSTFSFEEVMSPRHANGKRYLGGHLQHRVALAGGLLKSWKRKYFRLRDHGLVCYKDADEATPLFEVVFKAHSVLLLGKPTTGPETAQSPNGLSTSGDKYALDPTDASVPPSASSKPSSSGGPLVLILKHVEIVGHQTPASKVDVPLYLKADTPAAYASWAESLCLKLDARKRALAQASVHAVAVASGTLKKDDDVTDRTASDGHSSDTLGSEATDDDVARPAPVAPEPDPPEYALFQHKYLIMREVGEGSFSIVHKAVNRVSGRLCAVKCCKASAALEEEVGIMRRLAHPNLVGVEAVYTQDSMCFVVMDLMADGDLCDRLIARQRLPESEAQVLVAQVLQGLAYLHRRHVLHRDVKPENILLHGAAVKLGDFGLAKQLPHATARLARSCGTLEYAAPELLLGQPYGLKADVFSLGVVLYVLLFGAFPFSIESAAALQGMDQFPSGVDVRDMSCLRADNVQWHRVSRAAQDVLLRMLAPRESDRASAAELLTHPWFDPLADYGAASLLLVDAPTQQRRRSDSSTWQTLERLAADHERVRLADCEASGFRELLGHGLELTKLSASGSAAPHASSLSIDFAHHSMQWTARRRALGSNSNSNSNSGSGSNRKLARGRSILWRDVLEIRRGHATEAFARARDAPPPERCFSVVCAWRTLDLVAKSAQQREMLVTGFTRVVAEAASGRSGRLDA